MESATKNHCESLLIRPLDDLTNLPGITQVEIAGIRKPQIGIEVSESSLRAWAEF